MYGPGGHTKFTLRAHLGFFFIFFFESKANGGNYSSVSLVVASFLSEIGFKNR